MASKEKVAAPDFRLAAMVLMASGAAALGHEVLWTRRMIDLLGASAESNARVFECFFLGLSLGAGTASLWLPKVRRHWRVLGLIETGVAVLCLPALLLPEWTGWIWPSLGPDKLVGWQGSSVKTALSAIILLPPSLLMGMTLPVMASAVVAREPRAPDRQIWLYAANTLGGALGLVFVVLLSLQLLGASGSMLFTVGINLTVALKCFLRDHQRNACGDVSATLPQQPGAAPANRIPALALVLAFFSGAGVLSLEILGLTMSNLSAPLAIYPQASILVCVILVLAVAGWLVPKYVVRFGGPARILPPCLAATGLAVSLMPLVFLSLPGVRSGLFGYGHGFLGFLAALVGGTLLALGPAMVFGGTIFPLLISWCAKGDGLPGRGMGVLLAINGAGGAAGAEAAYRLLLPAFTVHVSIGVLGACYGLASFGLLLAFRAKRAAQYIFPLFSLLSISYVTSAFLVNLPVYYKARVLKVVDLRCGREGSLVVAEDARANRDMIFDNQYTLGGSASTPSLRRQAHLPLLVHPAPAKVAFIGLGTGITASGALEHEAVKSITAVELSSMVAEAAARDFGHFNHDICHAPRAKIRVEDARIYLEAARDEFDVIIGDLFTPWRPGEASLGSLEQFRAARRALRPGGVFCQWIEMTQWTPDQFQMAAATFRKAFGHLYLFRTGFHAQALPLGLLGLREGTLDWWTVAGRCEFEARRGGLADPVCRHPEGVAMLYVGEYVPPPGAESRVSTLGNLRIELSASKQLVAGELANYFSGSEPPWLNFLRDQVAATESRNELPEPLRTYPRLGLLASRFELALETDDPSAQSLARELLRQAPTDLAADSQADWSLWPGNQSPWAFLKVAHPAKLNPGTCTRRDR
jgi:spermidine synthase